MIRVKKASESGLLQKDVASMLGDPKATEEERLQLARHIICVVRERVLREVESYARQNIR